MIKKLKVKFKKPVKIAPIFSSFGSLYNLILMLSYKKRFRIIKIKDLPW